jgi:hypothetical protein
LIAVAEQTPRDGIREHLGADGKLRNQHMIRESEAFQIFSWCRQRARTSCLPLPIGVDHTEYVRDVLAHTQDVLCRADREINSVERKDNILKYLFTELAELTSSLLDDCSRFDRLEPPTTERTGVFRRTEAEQDVVRTDTVEMNWRRALAFDASTSFRRLIQIERVLNQSRVDLK